jgi:broad specificity phosphatase PhoE
VRLYFIRHGENLANIELIMSYKVVDYPLTDQGRQQAAYLAQWLTDHNIKSVYSSPLKRAYETAAILANYLAISEVRVLEDLRELNVGVLDGKKDPESWLIHDSIIRRWFEGEAALSFEGGENLLMLQERIAGVVRQIITENSELGPDDGVAIVAHGGSIVFGLPPLCPDLTPATYRVGMKNTATTIVETNSNILTCLEWGSVRHLPVEPPR